MWKILCYQGKTYPDFEINEEGTLRNIKTQTIYKTYINPRTGYRGTRVSLGGRNKRKYFKIHRCVAETFLENLQKLPVINHKDGNKTNNHLNNLEWCTPSYNSKHAINLGFSKILKGTQTKQAKLSIQEVQYIRNHYIPGDKNFGARALGRKFHISHSGIVDLLHYESYTDCI